MLSKTHREQCQYLTAGGKVHHQDQHLSMLGHVGCTQEYLLPRAIPRDTQSLQRADHLKMYNSVESKVGISYCLHLPGGIDTFSRRVPFHALRTGEIKAE